jgi:hypothetical protein
VDAAWIGAAGVLAGGITTALLGMVAETRSRREAGEHERQRAHELELRRLDLGEQHRSSLHAERRSAYGDFIRSSRRYETAVRELRLAMQQLAHDPEAPALKARYADAFNDVKAAVVAVRNR